jgi:hypothetical protein
MAALQQFEHETVYPRCGDVELTSIGDQVARRGEELLSSFADS